MHKRAKFQLPINIAVVVALLVVACTNLPIPSARLWDVQGNSKAEFSNWTLTPDETIECIQLSHDAQLVVTGSSMGLLRLWNAQSNQVVTVQAHNGTIHAIATSPDGTKVATFGEKKANGIGENDVRLWNLQGQWLEVFETDLSDAFA